LEIIRGCGYESLGHFTLLDSASWDDYYGPLGAKLPDWYEKYAGDDDALNAIESTKREIEVRRLFPERYGYEFFVAQKSE